MPGPRAITDFQTTPNPLALRCAVAPPLPPAGAGAMRSYSSPAAASAAGDRLAEALLAIPGVTNVLIASEFLTLTRAPAADWRAIKAAARKAVAEHP
ncbi:MAG: NifU N-terminal domain-containing protein [Phycisphaerales bacterium]|nr:NifU N-terminal domain-containing protein [Phycisphaerales bacterium]